MLSNSKQEDFWYLFASTRTITSMYPPYISSALLPLFEACFHLARKRVVGEHLPGRARHALAGQDSQPVGFVRGSSRCEAMRVVCGPVGGRDRVRGVEARADLRHVTCEGREN